MIGLLAAVTAGGSSPAGAADDRGAAGVLASYEGRTIDLSQDWEGAKACASDGVTAACFDSEAEMDRWVLATYSDRVAGDGARALLANCATGLKLHDPTGFGNPLISLVARGVWTNLSAYGFDNKTSSYVVGACSAVFAENASGGGAWYPGSTSAGASASTMVAGWSNRVSSIYIN